MPASDLIDRLEFQDDQGAVLASAARSYEPRRDVIAAVENKWGATTISKYAYDYDALARRTSVARTGEAFADTIGDHLDLYGYNSRNELTSAAVFEGANPATPGPAITNRNRMYEYDPIGNRQSYTAGAAAPTTYTTNNVNQYTDTAKPCSGNRNRSRPLSPSGVIGGF